MKNLRILYAGPACAALAIGQVFAAANLVAAGYSPADLIARGDVEETDDDATSEFPVEADELAAAQAALDAANPVAATETGEATTPTSTKTATPTTTATDLVPSEEAKTGEGALK